MHLITKGIDLIREQLLALFDFNDNTEDASFYYYLKVLLVVFILFKLIANRQTSGLTFHYNKQDKLMCDFISQSKIT